MPSEYEVGVILPPDIVTVEVGIEGLQGPQGSAGVGVPAGGSAFALLEKASATNYDTRWTTFPTVSAMAFSTSGTVEVDAPGEVAWNTDEGTLDMGLNGSGGIIHLGQETLYRVTNNSGTAIAKGKLVMAVGTVGNSGKILVDLAAPTRGGTAIPSRNLMGLTAEAIPNGSDGYVVHFGKVRQINTSQWSEGDVLFADPATPGGLTNVMPAAPAWKTTVAIVITDSASVGELFVRPTFGSNLSEDEQVTLTSPAAGQVLTYSGTVWQNQAPAVASVNGSTGTVVLTTSNVAEGTALYFTDARASAAAPVQSVNGSQGTVMLDASDVGALALTGGTVTGLIVAQDVAMNVTTGSSDTVALNFGSGDAFVSRAVSGTAVSITGTGYAPGVTRTVRLTGGTAVASLSVPGDWKFVGTAAGTSLGTAVTVLVTATSFGTAASDVVAAFAKQP